MINKIRYIITDETDPYKNLALEEYLFHRVGASELLLYLWQNERTVVIGRNQNPWKECKVSALEEDRGKLVRRLSGGGAVFHDLGNLNFTFLVSKENYNLERQLEVIVRAVNKLGIPAIKSGRNDITVEGRKFSGNAFYSDGVHSYHHGTILVHVDMSKLSHYLNVSREKLISKGVDSVRSRVTNLTEYLQDLTIDRMKEALITGLGEVYGLSPEPLRRESMDIPEPLQQENTDLSEPLQRESMDLPKLKLLEEKFSSWEWNYGKKLNFSDSFSRRFSWGDLELQLVVNNGSIQECAIYSDALETGLFEMMAGKLIGCPYRGAEMAKTLKETPIDAEKEPILTDIIALIQEEGI